jgi:hypothetical protein
MSAPPLDVPPVCFVEDVCRLLRISRRTLQRLRRAGAFPIEELGGLDKRPRWSGAKVTAFIEGELQLVSVGRRRRA